jgi:hypothetical protein
MPVDETRWPGPQDDEPDWPMVLHMNPAPRVPKLAVVGVGSISPWSSYYSDPVGDIHKMMEHFKDTSDAYHRWIEKYVSIPPPLMEEERPVHKNEKCDHSDSPLPPRNTGPRPARQFGRGGKKSF